jgi:hypothetical protein
VVEIVKTSWGRAPTFAIASHVASPKKRHTSDGIEVTAG